MIPLFLRADDQVRTWRPQPWQGCALPTELRPRVVSVRLARPATCSNSSGFRAGAKTRLRSVLRSVRQRTRSGHPQVTRPELGLRARPSLLSPVFGGLVGPGLLDVTSDAAALDSAGFWAVAADFEGSLVCARFADVRTEPVPPPSGQWQGPTSR